MGPTRAGSLQVAPLHQRGFQGSFRPCSPTLCGSFDQPQQQRNNRSNNTSATNTNTQNGTWLPAVDREETDPNGFPTVLKERDIEGADLKATAFFRSECEAEEEEEVEPEVRYRVRFADISLGSGAEDGNATPLPGRFIGQEAHESPPVHVSEKRGASVIYFLMGTPLSGNGMIYWKIFVANIMWKRKGCCSSDCCVKEPVRISNYISTWRGDGPGDQCYRDRMLRGPKHIFCYIEGSTC